LSQIIFSLNSKSKNHIIFNFYFLKRTFVCFHLFSTTDSIINLNKTIQLISTNIPGEKTNEQLANFYEKNSVINIEVIFF